MRFRFALALVFSVACPAATQAQNIVATTPYAQIDVLTGGWSIPDVFVHLVGQSGVAVINPGNCPYSDGYELAANDSYNQLVSSMLITAYASQMKIDLVISGCYGSRPHIIGINFHH